jgi:hypothetical protein
MMNADVSFLDRLDDRTLQPAKPMHVPCRFTRRRAAGCGLHCRGITMLDTSLLICVHLRMLFICVHPCKKR